MLNVVAYIVSTLRKRFGIKTESLERSPEPICFVFSIIGEVAVEILVVVGLFPAPGIQLI